MAYWPVDINKALAGKRFHLICTAVWFAAAPFWAFICLFIFGYYLGPKLGVTFNWRLLLLIWPFLYPGLSLLFIPNFWLYRTAKRGESTLVDINCPECKATPALRNRRDFFRRIVEKTPSPFCGKSYKFKATWKFWLLECNLALLSIVLLCLLFFVFTIIAVF